ncbi:hypothetical protein [Acinetobacter oleivorans]|uniref:hypothetical protein n=1 Tax=Acinetobacter oleivorans TaxID=1148157 RepID=UPI001250B631|nr:hypothetical protein [Acinetobacter oleivorans]
MTDLNKERMELELLAGVLDRQIDNLKAEIADEYFDDQKLDDLIDMAIKLGEVYAQRDVLKKAKAQAVPDTHLLVEKSKIETWWQDAEEPENFASRIEDMPSLGQYINGDEIMEITEHHTIHLPSKTIYGVWVDKDGDRSFCTGTMEECIALTSSESGAEG